MDEQLVELGRRAVACKGWRWLPGMRIVSRLLGPCHMPRVARATPGDEWLVQWTSPRGSVVRDLDGFRGYVPDLSDPATLGCLLALVREAYDFRYAAAYDAYRGLQWEVDTGVRALGPFETEAEALVAALEAAP